MDAQTERPYTATSCFDATDALRLDTSRASLHYLTRLALTGTGALSLNTIRATLL